jgi:hypothetical protein
MPGMESDKQIDQLLGKTADISSPTESAGEWTPPVLEFAFIDRVRIADAFFGP